MYAYVWLCMAMYGYVWRCRGMYGYAWLCRAMYGYVGRHSKRCAHARAIECGVASLILETLFQKTAEDSESTETEVF